MMSPFACLRHLYHSRQGGSGTITQRTLIRRSATKTGVDQSHCSPRTVVLPSETVAPELDYSTMSRTPRLHCLIGLRSLASAFGANTAGLRDNELFERSSCRINSLAGVSPASG